MLAAATSILAETREFVTSTRQLEADFTTSAESWLLAGGLFYTLGVVFFILDHWYPWAHVIWHLFVLAGSISHFTSVTVTVLA